MKTYQRYILFLLIIVGSVLLYFVFSDDIALQGSQHIDDILSYGSENEKEAINDVIEEDLPDVLLDKTSVYTGVDIAASSFDINDLKVGIGEPSLKQLLPLYEKQKKPEVLRYIIQEAINNYEFEFALDLLADERLDDTLNVLGIETYVFLMFNEQKLSYSRINRIKEVLSVMHDAGYISDIQFDHYLGLVALSRGDIDNWFYFLEQVGDDQEFLSWKTETESLVDKAASYTDVPEYYLETLIGSMVYRKQYLRIAQKIAGDIIADGNGYILPYQLVAYSSLLLKDYSQAQESLRRLLENDVSEKPWYTFLLGIVLYEQGEYAQSVFQFQTLSQSTFRQDGEKYLFLIYQKLEDKKRLMKLMKEIIARGDISDEEYIGFFDELFWSDVESTEYYLDNMVDDIDVVMESCYTQAENKQVCMYGKAGLFYQLGQYENAYKYLSKVVDAVYNTRIFIHLAEISERMGKDILAKKRYVRALRVSDDQSLSSKIRSSLEGVMNDR